MIELIIVMAIIIVLSALGASGFKEANRRAKAAMCVSNLRQLSSAFTLYTADNNNFFPGQGLDAKTRYMQVLLPYLGLKSYSEGGDGYYEPVFHCPVEPRQYYMRNSSTPGYGCYGYSLAIAGDNTSVGANILQISRPSMKVLVAEKSALMEKGIGTVGQGPRLDRTAPFPPQPYGAAANHRADGNPANGPDGPCNYLFVDGHVETLNAWPGANAFNLSY